MGETIEAMEKKIHGRKSREKERIEKRNEQKRSCRRQCGYGKKKKREGNKQ